MGLTRFSFLSKSLGFHTNVNIILPIDNYDSDETYKEVYSQNQEFKTLYLLHGGSGNAEDWLRFSRIEKYANKNNLAVIMPEVGGSSFYTDMVYGYDYFTYITEELPLIMEKMFPLSSRREDRFVAGLSMGGYGAFKWAFNKPEFFAAAANLSGASLIVDLLKNSSFDSVDEDKESIVNLNWGGLDQLEGSISDTKHMIDNSVNNNLDLPELYVCTGTEDFSYEYTQDFMDYARKKGIEITYEEDSGKHDWDFWDTYIKKIIHWFLHNE